MRVRCVFLEPTDECIRVLRRYQTVPDRPCPNGGGYHDARRQLGGVRPVVYSPNPLPRGGGYYVGSISGLKPLADSGYWPTQCDHCSFVFSGPDFKLYDDAGWQLNQQVLYVDRASGQKTTLDEAPIGAMWYADWMPHTYGPDDRCLVVRCPGKHDWMVDSRASNCTLPEDREHRCWVRHGVPPDVTVDKNGRTCGAGGGSIQVPGWHGYLTAGYLSESR